MLQRTSFQISYGANDARRVLTLLIAIEILLMLSYCLVHVFVPGLRWGPLRELVDLDRETAIPTWFSTVQFFSIGALLLFMARLPTPLRRYLILFGAGFFFLSMDEAAEIHEKMINSIRALKWGWLSSLTFGGSHKAWMIVYIVVALGVAMISYRFLMVVWRNFRREARILCAGLGLFAAGGIGLELLTFRLYNHPAVTLYLLAIAGEEFFEMVGMSVVLYGVLLWNLKIEELYLSGAHREW